MLMEGPVGTFQCARADKLTDALALKGRRALYFPLRALPEA